MTEPMLERVARGIGPSAWEKRPNGLWRYRDWRECQAQARGQAKAALESLMEPDEGMVWAMQAYAGTTLFEEAFKDAIQAALSQTEKP